MPFVSIRCSSKKKIVLIERFVSDFQLGLFTTFRSNRTYAPQQFPPHTIALACIYLAALLLSFEQPPLMEGISEERTNEEMVQLLGDHGDWEERYKACVEDLEGIFTPLSTL